MCCVRMPHTRRVHLAREALVRAPVEETQTSDGHKSGDLMSDVIHDARRLGNLEIALAKQELKELGMAYAITVGLAVGGGLLLLLGRLVAVPTFVVELVPWRWAAAVGWGGVYLLMGRALLVGGR